MLVEQYQNTKRQTSIWEIFAILIISLGMFQFVLEEGSILIGLSARIRQSIFIMGFIFDVFFFIEFLLRFINAIKNKKVIHYFFSSFGLLDLFSSLPVLLCFSLPNIIEVMNLNITYFIEPMNEFSSLTLLKFPRLGLIVINLMFIFPKRKHREVNVLFNKKLIIKGVSIGVLLIVLSFTLVNIFFPVLENNVKLRKIKYKKILTQTYQFFESSDEHKLRYDKIDEYTKEYISRFFSVWKDFVLLEIKKFEDDEWGNSYVIYSKYLEKEFRSKFLKSDIYDTNFMNLRILFTSCPFQKNVAKLNFIIIFIIIIFVLFYPILYGRFFNKSS